jgi:hypothetical protein
LHTFGECRGNHGGLVETALAGAIFVQRDGDYSGRFVQRGSLRNVV